MIPGFPDSSNHAGSADHGGVDLRAENGYQTHVQVISDGLEVDTGASGKSLGRF